MRDSLRAVLGFQSKKIGGSRLSFMHVGATTASAYTQSDLYKEANRRFWSQTGYKVGQKLDPKNPQDVPYTKIWNTVYAQVLKEFKTGTLKIPSAVADVSPATSQQAQVTSQVDFHNAQADAHQAQADTAKVQSAELAAAAVTAAAAGDVVKAAEHTANSNALNDKAQVHQEQADAHKDIAEQLTDIHSLSGLAYLASKSWMATSGHSKYFGWAIKEDGTVDTKWTDSLDEVKAWYDALGFTGFIWGLYWSDTNKDANGTLLPLEEYVPTITQAQADNALNAALGKAKTVTVSLKDIPAPTSDSGTAASMSNSSGSSGAVALMVVLGGGIALAAASSKKR